MILPWHSKHARAMRRGHVEDNKGKGAGTCGSHRPSVAYRPVHISQFGEWSIMRC